MSTDENTKHDRPSMRGVAVQPDFGPRYRVIGQLGKGGMGEVFRAYDTELKREVALKVVRGDADLDAALARFRREIALAAKVTSPNVLRVYDIAEHDGLRFLSMEYVDGEDLAHLMKREKQLPIERAVQIFKQVCAGLAAAHAQGVVHRDLKPQNVLLDKEGHVRVADFGLARSMTDSSLTASGAILGSPAYMSPEQVKGDPTDERSDIYSLGIMLYQLVTGETPFRADTPHAVMEMRLHKRPKPLRDVRADTPAYLEAIAAKCLALAPSARYAKMTDMLAALEAASPSAAPNTRPKWLVPALGGGLVVVLGAIAFVAWPRGKHETPAPARTSEPNAPAAAAKPVAATNLTTAIIVGFENHTAEPVFDGTIDLIVEVALRRSKHLDPITPAQARALATELHAGPDPSQIAPALAARDGVHALTIRGTVEPNNAGFVIAMTAADESGKQVLSQTEKVPSFAAVVPAAARLASALRSKLGETVPETEREASGLSSSLDVDHEFAIGRAMQRVNDLDGAIAHLEPALAKDPTIALAHVSLAIVYSNAGRRIDAVREFALALKYVDRLCERDRLKFFGDYHMNVTEDFDRSIASYEELLATWPKDIATETNVANAYQARGDVKKALEAGRRAAVDHPHNITTRSNQPIFEILAGDYDRAIADVHQIIAEFPRPLSSVYLYLAYASLFLGRRDDAIAGFAKYAELDPSRGRAAQADFAISEARLREAAALLQRGISDDLAAKTVDAAEVKEAMLAELQVRRGDNAGARATAAAIVKEPMQLFQAALVQLAVGDDARANATAARFASDVARGRRAMAKLIEAEGLRVHGKPQQAMIASQEALRIADSVAGHFLLARAALDAKRFAEAYTELQTCIARRAEASFDTNDIPSYRNVPLFTYYLARAQEGLESPDAKASYKAFLDMTHDPDPTDPLVANARKHL